MEIGGMISLPTDRLGRTLHIGDTIAWDGGDIMKIGYLALWDSETWVAYEDGVDDYADNLEGCLLLFHDGKLMV